MVKVSSKDPGSGFIYEKFGSLKILFVALVLTYSLLWTVFHVANHEHIFGIESKMERDYEPLNRSSIVSTSASVGESGLRVEANVSIRAPILPSAQVVSGQSGRAGAHSGDRQGYDVGRDEKEAQHRGDGGVRGVAPLETASLAASNQELDHRGSLPSVSAAKLTRIERGSGNPRQSVPGLISGAAGHDSRLQTNMPGAIGQQGGIDVVDQIPSAGLANFSSTVPLAAPSNISACVPWQPKYPTEEGFAHWLDELYADLVGHTLLLENIQSKDSLWRNVTVERPEVGRRQRALFFCGWVAFWDMETAAKKGGPSGEFVIWGDLIAGMAALGYRLTVVSKIVDMWIYLKADPSYFDIIITDYDGLGTAENIGHFPEHHCRYYIVDGFGTQPAFNMKRHLNLKRILVPYEFDGSNSVIHMVTAQLPREQWESERSPSGLIWAKDQKYLATIDGALSAIPPTVRLYTTLRTDQRKASPMKLSNVVNLGYKRKPEFLQLLTQHQFLIGVGSPLDGPTPLEAIAHGCAYINPKFTPPRIFQGKPTRFPYTSQHPFIEEHIGPPHAFTININNATALKAAVDDILAQTIVPFVHPHHRPDGYVANLRSIFDSLQGNCSNSAMPLKHPGNRVFPSFGAFARASCGGRCQRTDWVQVQAKSKALAAALLEFPDITMDDAVYFPAPINRPKRCAISDASFSRA